MYFLALQRTGKPLNMSNTRKRRRVFIGRQRPKTLTTSFGFTAQTRRLRQPRPAAAAAADQNSSKFGQWGR